MSTNDKLNLSEDEIADNERVWSGEELFRVTNPQLKAICDARGLVYESDANKRALVKTIMDAQVVHEGGEIAKANFDAATSVLTEENAGAIGESVESAAVAGVGALALDARSGHADAEFVGLDTMANEGGFPGSDAADAGAGDDEVLAGAPQEFLLGSDKFDAVIALGETGKTVQLGDVVARAHAESKLTVADWNGLEGAVRDALIDDALDLLLAEAEKDEQDFKEALTHKVAAELAQPYKEKQPKKIDTLHGSIDDLGTI